MNWPPNQVFVPDLSHYEWPANLNALADAGAIAIIWKATEGAGYQDLTYNDARAAAYAAGLLWGAYHFADGSHINDQINNFLSYATPTGDDLIALDFEDNDSNSMGLHAAQRWVEEVEANLNRPTQVVLYSGNRIKEILGESPSEFWGARRLWLAQYIDGMPDVPAAWKSYWLWQFTDGGSGPTPHTVAGVSGPCDVNAYQYDENQLKSEWASGTVTPSPPIPPNEVVTVTIDAPPGVTIKVVQTES